MKNNVLLTGLIGSGKTKSIETLLPEYERNGRNRRGAGLSVFMQTFEPGVERVLGQYPCEAGLHWHFIQPLKLDWDDAMSFMKKANTVGIKDLADLTDPNRRKYTQWFEIFESCKEYICDRCGENFGSVDEWQDDRCLVHDGLTGLSNMAMRALVGGSPFVSLPAYKAGQEMVEMLMQLTLALNCSYVLLAHVDKEFVPEIGRTKITASTIGQKLAPKLNKMFDEVILAERSGTTFTWSTNDSEAELKTRSLPWSDKIEPDFAQLYK